MLGVPVKPTIKEVDSERMVVKTLQRAALWEVQTPQVIRPPLLRQGFALVAEQGLEVTDDVSIIEALGRPVRITAGSYTNIKVGGKRYCRQAGHCRLRGGTAGPGAHALAAAYTRGGARVAPLTRRGAPYTRGAPYHAATRSTALTTSPPPPALATLPPAACSRRRSPPPTTCRWLSAFWKRQPWPRGPPPQPTRWRRRGCRTAMPTPPRPSAACTMTETQRAAV